MRYAIIADIHSNLAALTAVLSEIYKKDEIAELWCLGDIVGYGPEPHQCLELLRRTNHVCVAGNHDLAAIGEIDTSDFNPDAAAACEWTARQLTTQDRSYLKGLRLVIERDDFTLVHGSPRQPAWEYVMSISVAKQNFTYFQSKFCLVGHTHTPGIFKSGKGDSCSFSRFSDKEGFALGEERLIINPGAVGQPRDGDPRASYAIYDSKTKKISLYRIPYDVVATQAKMVEQRLPLRLVARLSHGT